MLVLCWGKLSNFIGLDRILTKKKLSQKLNFGNEELFNIRTFYYQGGIYLIFVQDLISMELEILNLNKVNSIGSRFTCLLVPLKLFLF